MVGWLFSSDVLFTVECLVVSGGSLCTGYLGACFQGLSTAPPSHVTAFLSRVK